MSKYIPSPANWVAEQVELYEGSGGTQGTTLKDSGLPVIIVTHRGRKSGTVRKTPLMRAVDDGCYILVASMGGAPKNPVWYHNLKADPNVESVIRRMFSTCGYAKSQTRTRSNDCGTLRWRPIRHIRNIKIKLIV